MSLFPAIVTLLVVMTLAASSARLAQDTSLLVEQRIDGQLARQRAEIALQRITATLVDDQPAADIGSIEAIRISDQAELGDLPLMLYRVTTSGQGHRVIVRVQADYAVDGCESADDDPCMSRVRRIAWRELSP
jgi:hypothetical protein